MILNGKALGTVAHYFFKEYQARGAPHYHILLWIDGAPVAAKDDDDVVLQWIQERITCRIPDKTTNPGLHQLVTRYQYQQVYVHRKQFPLILEFAVTVHKCQGLSLDCAIMDLSEQVFCPGMA